MWGKIIIPMYRLWLHGLYGLYRPWCPLSPKRLINLISLLVIIPNAHENPTILNALASRSPGTKPFDLKQPLNHKDIWDEAAVKHRHQRTTPVIYTGNLKDIKGLNFKLYNNLFHPYDINLGDHFAPDFSCPNIYMMTISCFVYQLPWEFVSS